MTNWDGRTFWLGIYTVSSLLAFSASVQKWNMHERCGQRLEGYGGDIFFDSDHLPHNTQTCDVTIVGNGTEGYMLSLYFTSLNVSKGCLANVTLREDVPLGLHRSFCRENPYLNPNLIYTTNGRLLTLSYRRKTMDKPVAMAFDINFVTFISRVKGCTPHERAQEHMFSCRTGRCVHRSLVCENLDPCGDSSDCGPGGGEAVEEEGGRAWSLVAVIVVVVGTVLGTFVIIQVLMVLKNKDGLDGNMEDSNTGGAAIDVEFMSVQNGGKRKQRPRDLHSDVRGPDWDAASETLITKEPV